MLADRPDVIIHLAAHVGGIGANREHPAEFFYDNLMMGELMHQAYNGGKNSLPLARCVPTQNLPQCPLRRYLWDGYPEETMPHGLAKKCCWFSHRHTVNNTGSIAFSCCRSTCMDRAIILIRSSHVIPALIRKCEARESGSDHIVVWGDGSPTREFIYVKDAARGIALATECYNESLPVNLGSGFEISIKDLAEKIARMTGFEGDLVWDTSKPNGQPRRALDTSRAREKFGFEAQTDFDEGLQQTIDWYLKTSEVIH